jgi:hypothetical protein
MDEPARFALHGVPRVFAVLCGQLVRHAGQHAAGLGKVTVSVLPGAVEVSGPGIGQPDGLSSHEQGFELAIARRISERFAWPLEWSGDANQGVIRVRFPHAVAATD